MKCLNCKSETLQPSKVEDRDVVVDGCPKCQGFWFDEGEIAIMLGERTEKQVTIPESASTRWARLCPKCNKALFQFCYPKTMTLIDMCEKCHGVWLDDRELLAIYQARKSLTDHPGAAGIEPQVRKRDHRRSDDIGGVKGRLLRFIDDSIDFLTHY